MDVMPKWADAILIPLISIILAFAAARGFAAPGDVWSASRVDELWQIEQWGADEEAEEVAALKEQAFLHAKQVWDLCQVN